MAWKKNKYFWCKTSSVFYFGFVSIALLLSTSTAISETHDRVKKDQESKEAFWNFHLFRNGKGMILSPNLINVLNKFYGFEKSTTEKLDFEVLDLRRTIARNRWGIEFERDKIAGLFNVQYGDVKIGAMGCVVCHGGQAAGQYYIGLGNKNIDVWRLAKDVNRVAKIWKKTRDDDKKSYEYKRSEDAALDFSEFLSEERLSNLTQGLVPVAYIRGWFYRVHGEEVPLMDTRGQVKVPALWGYGEKLKVGQFADGYGDGTRLGWAAAVELAAGQDHETVREYYPDVEAAEKLFEYFLPPKYPFEIKADLALKGKEIFEKTCANCHGTYRVDKDGLPIYESPKFIPWHIVKTDSDRIDGNTPEFFEQVAKSPLNDIIRTTALGPGYFAPRLVGIWARFPYLHNASVPNIAELLMPPEDRSPAFSIKNAGEKKKFDPKNLGLKSPKKSQLKRLLELGQKNHRDIYDTRRQGQSSKGHDFYTSIPQEEKTAIIEYLKGL